MKNLDGPKMRSSLDQKASPSSSSQHITTKVTTMVQNRSVVPITSKPFIQPLLQSRALESEREITSPVSPTSTTSVLSNLSDSSASSSVSTSSNGSTSSSLLSYSEGLRLHTERMWQEERKQKEEKSKKDRERKHGHGHSKSVTLNNQDLPIENEKKGGLFRGRRRSVHS